MVNARKLFQGSWSVDPRNDLSYVLKKKALTILAIEDFE